MPIVTKLLRPGLVIAIAACSRFGEEADRSSAVDGGGTTSPGPSATPPSADASLASDAGDGGPGVEALRSCPKTLVTRSFSVGQDSTDWAGSPETVNDAALARSVARFFAKSSGTLSDGAVIIASPQIASAPAWARVEWESTTLTSDPYTCFGCTIGPLERNGQELQERGRAYLATAAAWRSEAPGLYTTLDPWWQNQSKQLVRAPFKGYTPAWHRFALEMSFQREPTATVTVQAFIDGVLAAKLPELPWSPGVDGITSRCGALYMEAEGGGTATTDIRMDNVKLSVCPR